MAIEEREGLQINTSYWYEDDEINKILTLKITNHYAGNLSQAPEIMASVTNVTFVGGVQVTEQNTLSARLQDWEKIISQSSLTTDHTALIPCNLGLNHWVGILVSKDINGKIIRAEYVDSMENSIDAKLQSQFNLVYPNIQLTPKKLLKQSDLTSCGAYTIDNLFLLATNSVQNTSLTNVDIRLEHLKLIKSSIDPVDQLFYNKFLQKQLHDTTEKPVSHIEIKETQKAISSPPSFGTTFIPKVELVENILNQERPSKTYSLSSYQFRVNNAELTLVEYLKNLEKDRNQCGVDLTSKENLNKLLIHLDKEKKFLAQLSQCLSNVDLERTYGGIILGDDVVSEGVSSFKPSSVATLSSPTGAVPPPPPPPPGSAGIASSLPVKHLGAELSANINALVGIIKKYKISNTNLSKELKKLISKEQVIEFLDSAKQELSHIENVIKTEFAIQNKVSKNIKDFLNANQDIINGKDQHAKISLIKLFLHNLYREIYVGGDNNFSLIGISPCVIKRGDFYPLDYTKETYNTVAKQSVEELNQFIDTEITNIVTTITAIKNKAQNEGNFNPDQLVSCMKDLSKIEQEAFIALKLDEHSQAEFDVKFKNNKTQRTNYSDFLCDKSLIALDIVELFFSLLKKEDIKYITELGVIEHDDIEKLFSILMQSSSLNARYDEKDINQKVSTLAITKSFESANFGNIGFSDNKQLSQSFKNQEFVLKEDPISVIPMYCLGFVPKDLLVYLGNLRSARSIKLDKEKFKELFRLEFNLDLSQDKLDDLEKEMQTCWRTLAAKKIKKSNLTEFNSDLLQQVKDFQIKAQEIVSKHQEQTKLAQSNLFDTTKDALDKIRIMQKMAKEEEKIYERFCGNIFNFAGKLLNEGTGIISCLAGFNDFESASNGLALPAIIRGKNKLAKTQTMVIPPNNVITSKEHMTKNFTMVLFDLLKWLGDEEKLQLQLTEYEYIRIKKMHGDLLNMDGVVGQIEAYKKLFESKMLTFTSEQMQQVEAGISEFDLMDGQAKQNLEIIANKLKGFLKINEAFVVNLYDQINTLSAAKEILKPSETINFLSGVMYRDLAIKFKNSDACNSTLLKQIKNEDNIYEYFNDLQELIKLHNKFSNKEKGVDVILEKIKQTMGIDLLAGDDVLENIANLTTSQFKELTEILAIYEDCPSFFKKVTNSKDVEEEHKKFKSILEDIKTYAKFISGLQPEHKQAMITRGIPLDGIKSIEEASNNLPANLFARLIIDCMVYHDRQNEQMKVSFNIIEQLRNLDALTVEQIAQLNAAITEHANPKVLFDVKYLGLSKDFIDRNCVFCASNIDIDGKPTIKYTTLTEKDIPANEDSYYEVRGFKSRLMEIFLSYSKFLDTINQQSLLDNFTLVELAIIVRCLDAEHLAFEEQQLIKEAKKCIGDNGEGLVIDFIAIINQANVQNAIVNSIKNSFMRYIQNFISNISGKDVMDREKIINMIDNNKANIFNIIKEKINRDFYQEGALVDLSLTINSARQTIDDRTKIAKRKTLLELLNDDAKADSHELTIQSNEEKNQFLKEQIEEQNSILKGAFLTAADKAKEEFENKTVNWDVDNTRSHDIIPQTLVLSFMTILEKELNNLKFQEHIFQKIINQQSGKKINERLEALKKQIHDFKLKEYFDFHEVCKQYNKSSNESFKVIKEKHREIIAQAKQLFENGPDGIEAVGINYESIYHMNYQKLFESTLNKFVSTYESFVNSQNNSLHILQQQFLKAHTICNEKTDEIKLFIEEFKQEFDLKENFSQHQAIIQLDDVQEQAAGQLAKQKMEVLDKERQLEEKVKQVDEKTKQLKIAREETLKMQRENLARQEQAARALLEKEVMGKGLPETISTMSTVIAEQKIKEAEKLHQQQIEIQRELTQKLSEECQEIKGNLEEKKDLEEAKKNFPQLEDAWDKKKISREEALTWARKLYQDKKINMSVLSEFKNKIK